MLKTFCLFLVVVAAVPAWSQVEPAANGGGFDLDDAHMMTPPPVSVDSYPVVVGAESRTNFLDAGLVFTGSYVDNLMEGPVAVSDEVYYFRPSVTFDRRTFRQGESFQYSPGFNLYQNTSQLNGVTQDASADYRFHLSKYAVIQLSDRFWQNFNTYNQSNPFIAGGVTGGPGNITLIAPFANQLNNLSTAGIAYQYGRNAMIGGNASYAFLHYANSNRFTGLNNGNNVEGTAFYSRRIGRAEYLGVVYQFSKFVTHPIDTYTQTHSILGFYTHYFTRNFTLSVLGGPERYSTWTPDIAKAEAWTPVGQGILGWQSLRTNLGVSFTHVVSGAPGLNGAFHANLASLTGRVKIGRSWTAGATGEYSLLKGINVGLYPGGHAVSAGADVSRHIFERTEIAVGYAHIHESFAQVPSAAYAPDSNRVYGSIRYGFSRPIGR